MRLSRFVISLLLTGTLSANAAAVHGVVVGVTDGDTITVLDASNVRHKVRLAGIDAPEKKQPFGQRSKQSLNDLVFSKTVAVETTKRDRYGREVGKVLIQGNDANLEQIKRGMAWHYKAYQHEQSPQDRVSYSEAEEAARSARFGFWKDESPKPPREFRQR